MKRPKRKPTPPWPSSGKSRTVAPTCLPNDSILLGFHEGGLDEPRAEAAASFCLAAGADAGQVASWTEEGRRRAEEARLPRSAPNLVVHLGAHEPLYFANG